MNEKEKNDEGFSFSIENLINNISSSISTSDKSVKERLEKFRIEFNTKFADTNKKITAEIITQNYLFLALVAYAIYLPSLAVIEIHSTLERLIIEETAREIGEKSKNKFFLKLIERNNINELSKVLKELDFLDKDDLKFIKELNKLRNAIAHKNPIKISNILNAGRKTSIDELDMLLLDIDCIPYIIGVCNIIVKFVKKYNQSRES